MSPDEEAPPHSHTQRIKVNYLIYKIPNLKVSYFHMFPINFDISTTSMNFGSLVGSINSVVFEMTIWDRDMVYGYGSYFIGFIKLGINSHCTALYCFLVL